MKKLLFLSFLFLFPSLAFAKIQIKPFDAIGVKSISRDITAVAGECITGQVIKSTNGTNFSCQSDSTGSSGNLFTVSEDGVEVASADTLNFTRGIDAVDLGNNDIGISVDIATATAFGIASFDTNVLSITSGGLVSTRALKGEVTTTSGDIITTISNDAVDYAQIQNVTASDRVLGRTTAGAGDIEEVTFNDAIQDLAGSTVADDQVFVYDSSTAGTPRTIDDCTDTSGQHLNYTQATNTFSCGTTGDGTGGAGSTRVSEDGTHVVSADTIDFTTGIKATTSATGRATVSGDMATTTSPGIASFDSAIFTIGASNGGVSIGTLPVADGGTGATSLNNLITLSTHTTGDYVGDVTEGNYIDIGGGAGEGATKTVAMDPSEVSNVTWSDGGQTLVSWDVNVVNTGASVDVTTTYGSGKLNFNTPIETGRPGIDGALTIYSEQGDTDFIIRISPDQAMTADTLYTMPSADGTSAQVLHTTGGGKLYFDSDDTGAGASLATLTTISEDGTAVVASADTVDFRNGLSVASVGTNDARVSADLATTSQDGVVMLDPTHFKFSVTKLNDTSTMSLAASGVSEDNLKAVDSAVDEECLTYETTTGDFEWQSCGGGAGDITDVFDCTTGDCTNLTAASADLLDVRETRFILPSRDLTLPTVGAFRYITSRDAFSVFGGSAQTGRVAASQDVSIPFIQQKDFTLVEPDQIRTVSADFPIMNVDNYNYPSGIKITALRMFASQGTIPPAASNDATYVFQEWFTPIEASNAHASIDSIAFTSADNGEVANTSGFKDSDIAAGSLIYANLASTDLNWVKGTVYFYAKD